MFLVNEADDNTPLTEEVNDFLTAHDDECPMCRDANNVPEDDVLNRDITIYEIINVIISSLIMVNLVAQMGSYMKC